ncbi:MAG: glycosyltransferase family 1 protein [Deltaproteobacteria bacterium]|nr:MAG: glycosyltransferase family 1 protein [Deltaproteobacteria bacterium]
MKIAMYNLTTTTASGGIETFNKEMAKELSKRGHEVHIYGGKGKRIPECSLTVYIYPYKQRDKHPNFGTRFRKMAERWSMARKAVRDLCTRRYDIIYISKPYDMPWALWAAKRSGAKVVFSSGGTEFFPGYGTLAKRVDLITACSHFNADQIEKQCGIHPVILYNGVNTKRFKPLPAALKLKSRFSSDPETIILLSAGRLKRVKGFEYAIQAVAKLVPKFQNIIYLIAGDGQYMPHLKACAKLAGITKKVVFLGNVPNSRLPKYYSITDASIFSSIHSEAFGMSAAEAMACGVPVVGTTAGGIPEVIGDAGLLCPPKNSDMLAEKLDSLLSDSKLRKEMGEKGSRRINELFTWKHSGDTIESYLLLMLQINDSGGTR